MFLPESPIIYTHEFIAQDNLPILHPENLLTFHLMLSGHHACSATTCLMPPLEDNENDKLDHFLAQHYRSLHFTLPVDRAAFAILAEYQLILWSLLNSTSSTSRNCSATVFHFIKY